MPDLTEHIGKHIEVRVHKVYLTKYNRAVQQRHFFCNGNDFYTSDSDIPCILQHLNRINLTDVEPKEYEGISVYLKVNRQRPNFNLQFRHGIKGQKKRNFDGNSLKFDGCVYLQNFGDEHELKQMANVMPNKIENKIGIKRKLKEL